MRHRVSLASCVVWLNSYGLISPKPVLVGISGSVNMAYRELWCLMVPWGNQMVLLTDFRESLAKEENKSLS